MPFTDAFGDSVEKGALIEDEREVSADLVLADGGQTEVTMSGLVSVDEVVDVSITGEQVLEGAGTDEVSTAESVGTDGNVITVQFYLEDLTTAADANLTTQGLSASDTFTVTAKGY